MKVNLERMKKLMKKLFKKGFKDTDVEYHEMQLMVDTGRYTPVVYRHDGHIVDVDDPVDIVTGESGATTVYIPPKTKVSIPVKYTKWYVDAPIIITTTEAIYEDIYTCASHIDSGSCIIDVYNNSEDDPYTCSVCWCIYDRYTKAKHSDKSLFGKLTEDEGAMNGYDVESLELMNYVDLDYLIGSPEAKAGEAAKKSGKTGYKLKPGKLKELDADEYIKLWQDWQTEKARTVWDGPIAQDKDDLDEEVEKVYEKTKTKRPYDWTWKVYFHPAIDDDEPDNPDDEIKWNDEEIWNAASDEDDPYYTLPPSEDEIEAANDYWGIFDNYDDEI